jgi:carbonic anhydrase
MAITSPSASRSLSRRAALGLAMAGLGAGALSGAAPARADALDRPPPRDPDEAPRRLMEGNERFRGGHITSPHRNLDRLDEVAAEQHPFACVLACADSRVPVELIFDAGFGDLFVCRSAGNIASPELVGSLEYGAAVLGAQVVLVLGHSSCGAVKATIAGEPVPGQISSIFWHIAPAVERAGDDPVAVTAENARIQASLLRRASPVLGALVRERRLLVAAGVYDLHSREVRLL